MDAQASVAQLAGCRPVHQKVNGSNPIKAHSQVSGSIPGGGMYGRQLVDVFLSPYPSLPLKTKQANQ